MSISKKLTIFFILSLFLCSSVFLFFSFSQTAQAALKPIQDLINRFTGGGEQYFVGPTPVAEIVVNVITWMMSIIGVIAVAFIIYGGIMYATSAGNEQQIERAKKILLYAIIGLVIAIMALVIATLVTRVVQEKYSMICVYYGENQCVGTYNSRELCESAIYSEECYCVAGTCTDLGFPR